MPSITPGGEFAVNTSTIGNQVAPAIGYFADGSFVIVWGTLDPAQDGADSAIMGQRFDSAGNKVGPEFLVNANALGSQFTPAIAVSANGNFLVSWVSTDPAQDGDGNAIKAQLFDSSGAMIGGEFLLNTNTNASQEYGDIVALADGGFVATWRTTDTTADGNGHAVMARVFNASGVGGAEFLVNSA